MFYLVLTHPLELGKWVRYAMQPEPYFLFNFIAFKSELTVHMCFIKRESFLMDVKYLKLNKEAIESCL